MLLQELFRENDSHLAEANMVFARRGKKIVRRYRCTSGRKKGRVVNNPAKCGGGIDVKKRLVIKRTLAQKGSRMARKRKRTLRVNPYSKMVQKLNKARKK